MGIVMTDLLKKYHNHFPEIVGLYDYQETVLRLLSDKGNTLAIIPTGGGKSLLYQLSALDLSGITLVISPLKALMNEQVAELNNRGINAIAINSDFNFVEQRKILRGLKHSGFKLIYISPERLQNPFFRASLIAAGVSISMVVVDEAHCISQWGSGFRPDYSQIPEFIEFLNHNGNAPVVLCLTATLALNARKEIADAFKVAGDHVFISSKILRDNLNLTFQKVSEEEEKIEYLKTFLQKFKPQKAIVYLYSKPLTKRYAKEFGKSYATGYYNADIDADDKLVTYEDFLGGDIELLFATTAFGMGINIPDIESIIHFHIPNSIEEYYQQAGRGWRRKDLVKTCNCLALWSDKNFKERKRDLVKQKYTVQDVFDAYQALIGGAEITDIGQVVNKSKDALLNGKSYNLQLLRYKLEKYGVIKTIGELNGTPETVQMVKNTPLWNRIRKSAFEGMDGFNFVSVDLKIPLQDIIQHLYEQDLLGNIKSLPALKKDVYFEVLQTTISEELAIKIAYEININIDFRISQLEHLKELFEGDNINDLLAKSLN